MGEEYIEKKALLDEFHSLCGPQTGDGWDNWGVEALICRQKPADVAPVVRGEWIDMGDFMQCSACKGTNLKKVKTYYGEVIWVKSDFCPNCGAAMNEEAMRMLKSRRTV